MRNWWPWRRQNSLQSLFSERVPWAYENSDSKTPVLPPLRSRSHQPHPKNAPGDFYVLHKECIICGVPQYLAPELIAWEMDAKGRPDHCYFRKQPETALELVHTIEAMQGCCSGALRYGGSDPEIIEKLKEAGCSDAIDRP